MASFIFNVWKKELAKGTYRWNTNSDAAGGVYQIAQSKIVMSAGTYEDVDTVAAATSAGAWEYGSTRTSLANVDVKADADTNNRAELDADDTTVSSLAADGSNKVEGILLYVKPNGTSADSAYIPAVFFDLASPFYGNSSNVTFVWDSVGLVTLT